MSGLRPVREHLEALGFSRRIDRQGQVTHITGVAGIRAYLLDLSTHARRAAAVNGRELAVHLEVLEQQLVTVAALRGHIDRQHSQQPSEGQLA